MNENDFFEVSGYLSAPQRHCKLDAEMHSREQTRFEAEYLRLSGITPHPDDHNYYILHSSADKWGVELRINFDTDSRNIPQAIRNMIRSSRPGDPRNSRINDNELIWRLIHFGFLLGDFQDLERIRSRVPPEFIADFERGFSL